jgi:hypothetical protein
MRSAMRSLMGLLAGGAGLLAVLIAPAQAITITEATLVGGTVTVSGNKAAKSSPIAWEGSQVTTATPGGAFTFTTAVVPEGCVGELSDDTSTIDVAISGCPRRVVIDQLQPVIDITVGGAAIGGASEQQLAQTVTVGLDGTLLGVFLPVACNSGRLVVEIRTLNGNTPGDFVVAQGSVDAVSLPSIIPPVFRLIQIGADLPVARGDRFAVVLQNVTGSCGIFRGPLGDSYGSGEGFFQALPNPLGIWVPFSETETRLDLPFMTLMQLP